MCQHPGSRELAAWSWLAPHRRANPRQGEAGVPAPGGALAKLVVSVQGGTARWLALVGAVLGADAGHAVYAVVCVMPCVVEHAHGTALSARVRSSAKAHPKCTTLLHAPCRPVTAQVAAASRAPTTPPTDDRCVRGGAACSVWRCGGRGSVHGIPDEPGRGGLREQALPCHFSGPTLALAIAHGTRWSG